MPNLLSGGKPLKGTYGTSTIFITLPGAQPSLGKTPTTSTGYTLVTGPNGQLGFTSTLGGMVFQNSVIQTQTLNGDITIQSTGTGRLNLNGNVFINGQNALIATGTFTDLTVLNQARFLSSTTAVVFNGGVDVAGISNFQGDFNAFGNVFFESYGKNVTIRPTGIGSVDIYPETLGAIDNMQIGAVVPSTATFTTLTAGAISATSLTINGAPIGSGAAVISDTPPPTPYVGELWWDSTIGVLRVYYDDGASSQWVDAFPVIAGPAGEPGLQGDPGQIADVTTLTLYINNATLANSTNTGALTVLGGVGIGGDLYASTIYSNGLQVLTAANLTAYGVSEILTGSGITASTATGVVTLTVTDTLDSVIARGAITTGTISITNTTAAVSSSTGALTVKGGVGIAGDVYVGKSINLRSFDGTYGTITYTTTGDTFISKGSIVPDGVRGLGTAANQWNALYADQIFENQNRVVTSMRPISGPGIGIEYASTTGPYIVFTITNLGVYAIAGGVDIAVNQSTGSVVVSDISTLQSVTGRGATTTNAININNGSNTALTVAGRINAGSIYSASSEVWTKATLTDDSQLTNSAGYLTPTTLGLYGVTYLYAGYGITVNANTGTVTLTNTGVVSLTTGSGIAISTSSGAVVIQSIDTLRNVTSRGNVSTSSIIITNATPSTTSTNGALTVVGGVGVQGNIWAGNIYDNGNRVLNNVRVNIGLGLGGGGTISGPSGSVSLTNTGVLSLIAGTDTTISNATGNVTVWNTANLQSVTDRGNQTNNRLSVTNVTSATTTTNGALVVAGGVGVGGDLYASNLYSQGSPVITLGNIDSYGVTKVTSGDGISVNTNTGNVIVSSTATLALVTSYGATTPSAIKITNSTPSTTSTQGALVVAGGAGIGGDVYVGGGMWSEGSPVITRDTLGTFGVIVALAGTDTAVSSNTGVVTFWNVSTLQSVTNRGSTTSNAINITNTTPSTGVSSGALRVAGGVGINGNIWNSGDLHTTGNIYAGTVIGLATSTVAAVDLTGAGIVLGQGPVAGFTFDGTSGWNSQGDINPYGTYNLGALAKSWNNIYGSKIYDNSNRVLSSVTINPGNGMSGGGSIVGPSGSVTLNNAGVIAAIGTTYLGVSDSTGSVTFTNLGVQQVTNGLETTATFSGTGGTGTISINVTSTLDNVTHRGSTTTATIHISNATSSTSIASGALVVDGGAGIGDKLYVNDLIYSQGSQVLTLASLGAYGVTRVLAGTAIGVTPVAGTGTVTITNLGVQGLTAGPDIAVSSTTGTVTVSNTSTLQTVTSRGSSTNQPITISNATPASSSITGALTVAGGVGVIGDIYAGGNLYSANAVAITTATIAVYAVTTLTGTTYLGVSASTGSVTLTNLGVNKLNSGTDVSLTGTTGTITVNVTSTLQSITVRGATSDQAITLTNVTQAVSSNTGALVVAGGLGVGKNIYASGAVYSQGSQVITAASLGSYGVTQISGGSAIGVTPISGTGTVTITNLGVNSISGSQYIAVSTSTGTVQVLNMGVTDLIGSQNISVSTSTGSVQIVNLGVTATIGTTYIGVSANTGSVIFTNLGVQSITGSTGTAVSASTGTIKIWTTATLQDITNNGATTSKDIYIGSGANATTASGLSGALGVTGGVSITKDMYVAGSAYFGGSVTFGGSATNVLSSNTYYTDNLLELHIPPGGLNSLWNIDDSKDIGFRFHHYTNSTDTNAALVLAHDTKYLEWYSTGAVGDSQIVSTATYGTFKTGGVVLTSTATSNATNTGALIVAGGAGVGGNLYVGGGITSNNSPVLTAASLSSYGVSYITAGTGTAVSSNTGSVVVWSTASLQIVTDFGNTTNHSIAITNSTSSTSVSSGALTVIGGAGIGGNLYVGGILSATNINITSLSLSGNQIITGILTITNVTSANSIQSGALQVAGGVGIGGNLYFGGQLVGGSNSTVGAPAAVVVGGANNTASGLYSIVGNGLNNLASGAYSQANGKGATTRGIIGANAFGYNSTAIGDTQIVNYLLNTITNSSTASVLTSNAGAPDASNQIIMPINSVYGFKGIITARNTATNDIAVWEIKGGIKRGITTTPTLVGTPVVDRITYDTAAASWGITVGTDTTYGGLQITANGPDLTSIRWVANITTVEVQ